MFTALPRDLVGIKKEKKCYGRSKVKHLKNEGSTAVWVFAFLLTLRRPVIVASFLEVMLGIAGLAGSKTEIRCGGWEVDVVYVRQVGH